MSDFMMSQLQGLLGKVSDDLEKMGRTTNAHLDSVLGAIDDLAANVFATQAVLAVLLEKYPVDPAKAKAWIVEQTGADGATPKADAIIDMLTAKKK
ncbi:MAG: hypothetical protein JNK21_15810 [Rhodospirillaceae bacterium]|nr:hypothetical protein [Rhodospirillaceae bacterium]